MAFQIYVVYKNPSDFPGEYVVRAGVVSRSGVFIPGQLVARGKTLRSVRSAIPPWFSCVPRDKKDDPVVVESWL